MKIKYFFIIITLLVLLLSGCSANTVASQNENVEQTTSNTEQVEQVEQPVVPEKDVELLVLGKNNLEEDSDLGRYSPFICFVFEIKNNTDKDIKSVQGTLAIHDMFGVTLVPLGLDITGEIIPAGSSITVSNQGFYVNEYVDAHTQVYNTDFENLLFNFYITTIIYTDDTQEFY
jgi:hypothetical protein